MRRHGNSLYITTPGAYLAKDGETVAVRIDGETRLRVPIHTIDGLVCFGQVSASPFLLGLCAERGVGVSLLTERGRFLARVQGPVSGNVLLRREQYRRADTEDASAALARSFLGAKIANSRWVLLRWLRAPTGNTGAAAVRGAAVALRRQLDELQREPTLDGLRGIEGLSARQYFEVFDHLIGQRKDDFRFERRNRRPPTDPVNALLSFLYTLLRHDCESALESVGLDPAVGFLHRDRPGRASLALDLMEELRPYLADRLALSLINKRQVQPLGFTHNEAGAVWMDDDTRKVVITAYQLRKDDTLEHPFLQERTTVGLLMHLQALLLARHLRGDLDGYPPFFAKG
jgi:CRISPR-associated protein Cas1